MMRILQAIVFSVPLFAQQPSTFKGFKLGGTQAEALAVENLDCRANRVNPSQVSCRTPMPDLARLRTGGANPVGWHIGEEFVAPSFEFVSDSLVNIHGFFQSSSFSVLKEIFETKYGKPASDVKSNIQNALGNAFVNETVTWRSGSMVVRMTKFNSTLEDGAFDVYTADYFTKIQKQGDDSKKKAAAGL